MTPVSPWINADEHPPDPGREVLMLYSMSSCRFVATWDATNKVFRDRNLDMIPGVYYMPIHELPEPRT